MRTVSIAYAAAAALLLAQTAIAQDGPNGIAFVQAPEQGGGTAVGATMEAAFADAVAQCMESGAAEEDCLKTNWCQPAGWSVDIFMQHEEGPHWHEVICGLPTETIAKAAATHMCDKLERPYLIACQVVQVYDQDGNKRMPE